MTNTRKSQKIIRKYFENLYSKNLENLDDQPLEAKDLPKLIQEDINHLSRAISNEIEAVVKRLLTKKNPGPDGWIHCGIQPEL
jgi:hypothetical protein